MRVSMSINRKSWMHLKSEKCGRRAVLWYGKILHLQTNSYLVKYYNYYTQANVLTHLRKHIGAQMAERVCFKLETLDDVNYRALCIDLLYSYCVGHFSLWRSSITTQMKTFHWATVVFRFICWLNIKLQLAIKWCRLNKSFIVSTVDSTCDTYI